MKISIQSIAAILVADIDIFLLQNENQMADNDKEFYTKEEVRNQLEKTNLKFCEVMTKVGYNIKSHFLIK